MYPCVLWRSRTMELLPDFDDRNIVYNFHCYEPQLFTHQSAYWVENMPLDFHIGYPADWDEVCRLTYDMNITPAILCIEESQKMEITSFTPAFFEKIFAPAVIAQALLPGLIKYMPFSSLQNNLQILYKLVSYIVIMFVNKTKIKWK